MDNLNDPQIDNSQQPMYYDEFAPMPENKVDNETLKWQLSSDDVLENLRLSLLNKRIEIDENGNPKIVGNKKPLVNEKGVETIMMVLRPHFQRGVILSNFEDKEILKIMRILRIKLILLLKKYWKEWDIQKGNLAIILETIDNVVFSTFKRAENEGERRYLTTTQRINENRVINQGEAERRGFNLFRRERR